MIRRSKERKILRWNKWDYSYNAWYFVTICCEDMVEHFGEIRNGIMGLSKFGLIAQQCWTEIPRHFKHVRLDEFIIMPNHIHGIVIIDRPEGYCGINVGDADLRPLHIHTNTNKSDRSKMVLPKIIHGFKSSVTRSINQSTPTLLWQRSYYDHIIRSEKALMHIRRYIKNNPTNWEKDRNNQKNVWY